MRDKSQGPTKSRTDQLGKICHEVNAGRAREDNSIPRDWPRVSSSTSENQCVIQLKPLLLAGSPTEKTMNTFSNVKLDVVHSVHTATGHSQKNEISPRAAGCYLQIKVCEKCFLCHSIVLCKSFHKCSQCCHKSACRGQTAKLSEKVVRAGCWSESSSNPEGGLHSPLSDPAELIMNSHKLLWQSSQKSQTVRGITSAYGQKYRRTCAQLIIFSPNTKQQVEAYPRPKQSEPIPEDRKIQNGDTGNDQGEWVTSIDFKDAYLHITIQEQSRKYLRFHIQD